MTTLNRLREDQATFLGIRLIAIAELIRLVPAPKEPTVDNQFVRSVLSAFANEGVARNAAAFSDGMTAVQMVEVLGEVFAAVEESPLPMREWEPISEILGDELLADLVKVSASSIHRYRAGERTTPDHIADRLHTLTLIVADLSGSYNGFGIRRWFGRKRSVLSGQSPADTLQEDWTSHDDGTQRVRALAASLLSPLAA